ncbi:hypothetical protein ABT009_15005 [Streptomyces sp. NPDC002896]|uniref:hypothetical protein n=1 Tax=Streptomyces sp. NPDC002896 TaxID=3154438 RepID=UPI00331E15F4
MEAAAPEHRASLLREQYEAEHRTIDQALESKRPEDYQLDEPRQLIAERMTAILRATAPPRETKRHLGTRSCHPGQRPTGQQMDLPDPHC